MDGRLKSEEGERFGGGGSESASHATKTFVLDHLKTFHQSDTRSRGTKPQLASISHHGNDAGFEQEAKVIRSHASNGIS